MIAVALYVLTVLTVAAGLLWRPAARPHRTRQTPARTPRMAFRDSRATGDAPEPAHARTANQRPTRSEP